MGKKTNDMQKARDEKNLRQKLADETGYAKATIRDARAIGCTEAQIMAVKNEEALRALIVNVDPKKVGAMPVAALKEAAKPITPAEPVNMKQETRLRAVGSRPLCQPQPHCKAAYREGDN
jgi:hypothetical protein